MLTLGKTETKYILHPSSKGWTIKWLSSTWFPNSGDYAIIIKGWN